MTHSSELRGQNGFSTYPSRSSAMCATIADQANVAEGATTLRGRLRDIAVWPHKMTCTPAAFSSSSSFRFGLSLPKRFLYSSLVSVSLPAVTVDHERGLDSLPRHAGAGVLVEIPGDGVEAHVELARLRADVDVEAQFQVPVFRRQQRRIGHVEGAAEAGDDGPHVADGAWCRLRLPGRARGSRGGDCEGNEREGDRGNAHDIS